MATVTRTGSYVNMLGPGDTNERMVQWTLLDGDDNGSWMPVEGVVESVHALGTFDSGSVALNGSNEQTPTTAGAALTHNGTNAIAITAEGVKKVWEQPAFIRPIVTGGGASCSLTVLARMKMEA